MEKTSPLYTDTLDDMVIARDEVAYMRRELICRIESSPGNGGTASDTYAQLALDALSQAETFFRLAANFCEK